MRADLSGQIHELMERGLRPVTMADIEARPPVRVTMLHRAAAKSPLGHRRIMLAGAAAAVVSLAVAVTAIIITSQGGPSLPPASEGAVRLLAKVADAAAHQPTPHVRNGQYMYVETKVAMLFTPQQLQTMQPIKRGHFPRNLHLKKPIRQQTWVPVSDACREGLIRTEPGGGPGAKFDARGPGVRCPNIGGLNDATYRLLQTLPTDPHALLAMIYKVERGHGPSPDQEAFVTIGDLLNGKIPPPKVAAALYRAAALIAGVTLVPNATDAIGRHGVAVAQTADGIRTELIFSKTTLRLIGERTIMTTTGNSTSATAIISQAFVNHLGQEPPSTPNSASG
jgi:hypothetical protein